MSTRRIRGVRNGAFLALGALLVLGGCELMLSGEATFSWDSVNDPSGRVVNAYEDNEGVTDVSLTLEYISGAPEDEVSVGDTFTGTSGVDGQYSISSNVPYGTYVLRGSKSGFAFIDQTIELNPDNESLPDLIGVPYDNESDVSIVALWSSSFDDVNAYVTYPDAFPTEDDNDGYKGQATLDTPNDTFDENGRADPGFFVGDGTNREQLSDADGKFASDATFGNLNIDGDASTAAVGIERLASQGSGPETVAIRAVPIDWPNNITSYDTSANDQNLLPDGNTYAWVGVLQYYVHGESGSLSVEGESAIQSGADLTVYVTQGPNVLGKYRVPEFTDIDGASLIRINLMARSDGVDFYQIIPDMQLVPEESDGTFDPATVKSQSRVLNVPARTRG